MIDQNGPLGFPELTSPEIQSLRLLEKGTANSVQQNLALQCILQKLCRTYDLHYLPEDERGTIFLQGRGYVGQRIMRAIRMQPAELRKLEEKEKRNAR